MWMKPGLLYHRIRYLTVSTGSIFILKNNMHGSISSDCPHRERLAYTGDGQVLVESMLYAFDCTRFLINGWTILQMHKTI